MTLFSSLPLLLVFADCGCQPPEAAFARFWAVRGIPVANAAVSQWGEVTRAQAGYDTGSMGGFRSTTVCLQQSPLQALSAILALCDTGHLVCACVSDMGFFLGQISRLKTS